MLQALYMAKMTNNKTLNRTILSALSTLYTEWRMERKQWSLPSKTLPCRKIQLSATMLYILGNAYYENRQYDSASFYLNKALPR